MPDVSESAPTPVRRDAETEVADTDLFPEWFSQFLNDRQTRKPSAHTMKAYRQDFIAIATLVAGGNSTQLAVTDITKDWDAVRSQRMRVITKQRRFAAVGRRGMCCAPSSIRVSSWLLTPCSLSGDRSWPGSSPRLSPAPQCKPCWRLWRGTKVRNAKLIGLNEISRSSSLCSWPAYAPRSSASRTLAIFAPPITGPRPSTSEAKAARNAACRLRLNCCRSSVSTSIAAPSGFQGGSKRKAGDSTSALSRWPARSPLFVGRDGERITRGTLQSRIKRSLSVLAPKRNPSPGALVHGLRHTYATELAGADVSVYTLMKLMGHESMTTSQRYVTAAGTETGSAAARNGLYALIPGCANDADLEIWLDRDS